MDKQVSLIPKLSFLFYCSSNDKNKNSGRNHLLTTWNDSSLTSKNDIFKRSLALKYTNVMLIATSFVHTSSPSNDWVELRGFFSRFIAGTDTRGHTMVHKHHLKRLDCDPPHY